MNNQTQQTNINTESTLLKNNPDTNKTTLFSLSNNEQTQNKNPIQTQTQSTFINNNILSNINSTNNQKRKWKKKKHQYLLK